MKNQPKEQSNVERFYEWLQMCKNVYLGDSVRVERAFNKIPNV